MGGEARTCRMCEHWLIQHTGGNQVFIQTSGRWCGYARARVRVRDTIGLGLSVGIGLGIGLGLGLG